MRKPGDIGDLASTEKGSGARFSAGKPDLGLIPLRFVAEAYTRSGNVQNASALAALYSLADWQEDRPGGPEHLWKVLDCLGDQWDSCAHVFTFGRKKYAAWNWAKGMPWSVPMTCAARHLRKLIEGVQIDEESGEMHEGHVYANVVMLLLYAKTYQEGDDRPKGLL